VTKEHSRDVLRMAGCMSWMYKRNILVPPSYICARQAAQHGSCSTCHTACCISNIIGIMDNTGEQHARAGQ
jgi:hypothetical protein